MRRVLGSIGVVSVLAVCVAGCRTTTTTSAGGTIQVQAPQIGQLQHETSTAETHVALTVVTPAQSTAVTIERTEVTRQTVEVLEVNGLAPTKIRVTYDEKTERSKESGEDKVQQSPLMGHTYVVEEKDGRTVVTGQPMPSPAEEALVMKDYKRLGQPDPFVSALPNRELHPGDEVPELATTLAEELGRTATGPEAPTPEVQSASVKVRELLDDRVTFDVVLTFTQTQPPVIARADLSGTIAVFRSDGWPAEMLLTGPLTFTPTPEAAKEGARIDGHGKSTVRFDVRRE